mmetsp:Transcript_28018/g.68213  ORF Transcript_28018/g.68213 Transcript_28018/m.68213 type:complete len:95 (+) Transcript_28018:3-287(+)
MILFTAHCMLTETVTPFVSKSTTNLHQEGGVFSWMSHGKALSMKLDVRYRLAWIFQLHVKLEQQHRQEGPSLVGNEFTPRTQVDTTTKWSQISG